MRFFVLLLFYCTGALYAQETFRVITYNVENMFDTADNPAKEDNEFLPEGSHAWTPGRYYYKLRQIAKVISAAGEWGTPALIGLCEVENDSVLYHLTHRTPLRKQGYRYLITDGPDIRGINVGLLYHPAQFHYLTHQAIPIRFSKPPHKPTREILHVCGLIANGDTLDLCVCHFPSRYGGEKMTERERFDAARTLREVCDSIRTIRQTPKIIAMGDFNDTPTNRSLTEFFAAKSFFKGGDPLHDSTDTYYDLFADLPKGFPPGSHKYQGVWGILDHIVINKELATPRSSLRIIPESIRIFAPNFLLIPDDNWFGVRPFRTYFGYKYEGGFSDHLPLIVDFYIHLPAKTDNTHAD